MGPGDAEVYIGQYEEDEPPSQADLAAYRSALLERRHEVLREAIFAASRTRPRA